MPEFTSRTFLQNEASLATQILAASRHEQSQPAVQKPQSKRSSDSASIKSTSSFGSTVSLLKSKFHRPMESEQQRRLQRSAVRNQVRIGC
jgi:hypothetical protein